MPLVAPPAIVRVKGFTAAKSVPAVAVPPATEIVTGVSATRAALSRVAVTVTVRSPCAAPSDTLGGERVRVAFVEVSSLSSMVNIRS